MFRATTVITITSAALSTSACIVAGYSSRSGWHIWPGSLFLTIVLLVFILWQVRKR